jgi:hypothetical protein
VTQPAAWHRVLPPDGTAGWAWARRPAEGDSHRASPRATPKSTRVPALPSTGARIRRILSWWTSTYLPVSRE